MTGSPDDPALNFDCHLPQGQMWFSVRQVARHLGVSAQHISDLVNEGRFTYEDCGPIDLAGKPRQTRCTTRIPRACLVAFLQSSADGRLPLSGLLPSAARPPFCP